MSGKRRTVAATIAARQTARDDARTGGRGLYAAATEMQRVRLRQMAARGDEKAAAALRAAADANGRESES